MARAMQNLENRKGPKPLYTRVTYSRSYIGANLKQARKRSRTKPKTREVQTHLAVPRPMEDFALLVSEVTDPAKNGDAAKVPSRPSHLI